MVIDFGAHLYPQSVFPEPIEQSPLADILGPLLTDPDELLALYDQAGVQKAVLSQPFYMGLADADRVRTANDALLEVVENNDRFYGLAAIPTTAGGEAAAAELERAVNAGYHGGAVETSTSGVELTDDDLEPVFEAAVQADVPLLVHPKLDESLHPEALDDTYMLNAIFGREAALSASICKVIHEGVFNRYPDLTLVYHHLGGNLASMLGRVHLQLDSGRWPRQERAKPWSEFRMQPDDSIRPGQERVKPWSEFRKQLDCIYLDTSGFFGYQGPVEAALNVFPPENVIFGTDYPFEPRDGDELASLVNGTKEAAADSAQADKVLKTNAEALLGG